MQYVGSFTNGLPDGPAWILPNDASRNGYSGVWLDADSQSHALSANSFVNFSSGHLIESILIIQANYDYGGRDGVIFAHFSEGDVESSVEVAHLDPALEIATVGKLLNGTWLESPRVGKVTGMGEHRQVKIHG